MTPTSTYRLQLTPDFGFDAAATLAPYLAGLGISHVYLSPHLQAAPGSTHGYDVIDYGKVSDELGGAEAHARMFAAFRNNSLSVVVDVVPNHMSIARASANAWWWDVLENGQSSQYADYFDVDWEGGDERTRNKVLLPVLGDHYGRVLDAGRISVVRDGGRVVLKAYDQIYPVGPRSVGWLLQQVRIKNEQLGFIADALEELPSPTTLDDQSRKRRHRDRQALGRLLAQLIADNHELAAGIDETLTAVTADVERLHELLERLSYRLAYWRSARFDLDYRRFFDINELVGLRMNEAKVFADTHALILDWVKAGMVTGLRIDHPDGLLDPGGYFERLRAHAPAAWIVVEKILGEEEQLPKAWPVQGTTGYDFCSRVSGLFVDSSAEPRFNVIYRSFTGAESTDFASVAAAKKRYIVREVLGADVRRITERFVAVCERHRAYRDTTRDELRSAIEALLIALPVYRTYVRAADGATESDRTVIEDTIVKAREMRPDIDGRLFELMRDVLTGRLHGPVENEALLRFQQASGPITAKGVEDTAFYTYQRFIAANEVGGNPDHFGTSVSEFHAYNTRKQTSWPVAMLATSTHDTKRSEDVRARLAVLTEVPDAWHEAVLRWSSMSQRHRDPLVDRDIELHIYQTLVGAWPLDEERLTRYLEKAMREAKVHTAWTRINEPYENAVRKFGTMLLKNASVREDIEAFVQRIQRAGEENALAQKLLTLTSPGVPDIYQGNELWDYSLTDPDNRRPVDFDKRQTLLERAAKADVREVLADWLRGLPKLWLTMRALEVRRARPECFNETGTYTPVAEDNSRVVAFMRGSRTSERKVLVVTTRLRMAPLETRIEVPKGSWRNVFTEERARGGNQPVASLLSGFSVGLFLSE